MTDIDNSRIMKFQLVQRVNCPDVYTHMNYPLDATFREMAELTMNIKRTTYQFFAVRVGRDYVGLDELVHDYRVHKVVFIQQLENPFPSDDTLVEKIAGETPMCIFITTGPHCNRFQEGFYPAFGKLTVKQFMTMIERMGNGCWCSDNEHYWILKDNEVVFLNDHSRKLVQNVITNQMDMIYSRAQVNDADEGFSPRMQPSNWRPDVEHFVCDAVNFGHPARMDGYDEDDDATITDSDDSPDEIEFDLDTTPVDALQKLKVKTIDALKPMLKTLYSLEKELLRRGCDGSLYHKFDDILITFPSDEPEDEPDDDDTTKGYNNPDAPRSSSDVQPPVQPVVQPAQQPLARSVQFRFNDMNYNVDLTGIKTLGQFRDKCVLEIGGIKGKDLRLQKENGNEITEKNSIHLTTLGIVAGTVIKGVFRGRGGGKKTGVKNAMLKEHTMTYKRGVMTQQAEKARSVVIAEFPEVLNKASIMLNDLYQKLEPHPRDTFAKLIAPLSIAQLDACLDCFKSNKVDTRIAKLSDVVMKHHLPKLYGIRDEYEHVLRAVGTFFDLMLTSSYARDDMEWDWASARKAISHTKELKELRASTPALASTDDVAALTAEMQNTRMTD